MKLYIHQTHHSVGDFNSIFNYIKNILQKEKLEGLHLFPELFLTGYPLQDLCLQKQFINKYNDFLEEIDSIFSSLPKNENVAFLMGGLDYTFDENQFPSCIKNSVFLMMPGQSYQVIYSKRLLPNYDIFDERKYFTPGTEHSILKFKEKNIALLICEDMWHSSVYNVDPIYDLIKAQENETNIDLIVNLSASPFHIKKHNERLSRALDISNKIQAPFAYINRVGGEDEILFDGSSFIVNNNKVEIQADAFKKQLIETKLNSFEIDSAPSESTLSHSHTWESLFSATINYKSTPPTLSKLTDDDCKNIIKAICFGLQEYSNKCNFDRFTVALSGGIDSSLVLTLCKLAFNDSEKIEAIYMPGLYSATESYELSYQLAKSLNVKINTIPIKFLHSTFKNIFLQNTNKQIEGTTDENLQSRIRGVLLYAQSNFANSMVLNTSNKSEIAVGYSTLYGDSVGALSLIGDLYKSEVYQLSKFINKFYDDIIPQEIIERGPSAELRPNQLDSDSLPAYSTLDPILEGILSSRLSVDELIATGFKEDDVHKIFNLYNKSEFKRNQFCPIIKLKHKSFGFGYRMPICKSF